MVTGYCLPVSDLYLLTTVFCLLTTVILFSSLLATVSCPLQLATLSQNENVTAEMRVLEEIAATAKSASPFISFAIMYAIVAVGDARSIRPGRYSFGGIP